MGPPLATSRSVATRHFRRATYTAAPPEASPGTTLARMSITGTRTVASIVGGEARSEGERIESRNPANLEEVVCEAVLADADVFVDACEAARAAQREWAAVPAPVRGKAIQQIGRLVEQNKEALARLVTREIGKPYPESLGEVQEIVDTCDFFVGEGRRLYGQTVPSEMPDKQLFTFRNPVGVAAIITAGNFPVAVPSWYLVPAILCGNAVVWNKNLARKHAARPMRRARTAARPRRRSARARQRHAHRLERARSASRRSRGPRRSTARRRLQRARHRVPGLPTGRASPAASSTRLGLEFNPYTTQIDLTTHRRAFRRLHPRRRRPRSTSTATCGATSRSATSGRRSRRARSAPRPCRTR